MKRTSVTALLCASVLVSACAQNPDKIAASYVSPNAFDGRTCSQLTEERNEIVSRVNQLTADQKKSATNDAVATGVALVLFWPAAFALAVTEDHATALSAAKGNYDAITTKMTQKGCRMPANAMVPA